MAGNAFGTIFKLTTFGESHGTAIGGVIDGCPAGIAIDFEAIQLEMDRRKPGQSNIVTQRKEPDTVKFLSGIFEGFTTGTPIGFVIENANQKSKDYTHIKDVFRPSHADYTYTEKYGQRDYRGGGRSSARETACRVVAGAIAKQFLKTIDINAYTSSVGEIALNKSYKDLDLANAETNDVRCPDSEVAAQMISKIKAIRKEGDTIGGVISCVIKNVPVGLGEPVFDRLHAQLGWPSKDFNMAADLKAPNSKAVCTTMLSMPMALPKQIYLVGFKEVSVTEWTSILMWLLSPLPPLCKLKTRLIKMVMLLKCTVKVDTILVSFQEQCPLSKPWQPWSSLTLCC